jgi:Flp pilus assembly protein TadB
MNKYQMPPLTALRFAMLAVLAGLLIALMLGMPVPRVAIVILILAQGGLRYYVNRTDPKLRNSSLFQLLVSAVLGYLILTS